MLLKGRWFRCRGRKRKQIDHIHSFATYCFTSGNLSVRSLADVVSKDDFIRDSEYLETVLVAVPKSVSVY